jgi:hypothetical protein
MVKVGKGHARQGQTQIRDLVSDGNRIQTNQTASAGTYKAMVKIGKGPPDQTKSTMRLRHPCVRSGKGW